jgi:hypothetical protein
MTRTPPLSLVELKGETWKVLWALVLRVRWENSLNIDGLHVIEAAPGCWLWCPYSENVSSRQFVSRNELGRSSLHNLCLRCASGVPGYANLLGITGHLAGGYLPARRNVSA